MPKTLQPQNIIQQIKLGMDQLLINDQRKCLQKLNIVYKDLLKNAKENNMQDQQIQRYFYSLKEQLCNLKKDVLNNKKKQMSDYQAFLWYYQLCQKQKEILPFYEKKIIMNFITLPLRARNKIIINQHNSLMNGLSKLDFCPLGYSINDLIHLSQRILFSNPYCEKNFSPNIITKLLTQISKQYMIVSYHNFTHAFSVQLMLFQCLDKTDKLNNLLSDFQIFITYIAALSHDMGHNGTNSDFQVKKKTEIAQIYNNQSVLENMHISKFNKMLRKNQEIDIISQIKDPVQRQRSKRLLVKLILGTDMTKHFDGIKKINEIQLNQNESVLQPHQKQTIHQNLFHACDIGNCCLQFGDFMNWAMLLSYEFNSQYERQLKQSIAPTVFFKFNGMKQFYRSQINFIDNLAAPLWKGLYNIYDGLEELINKLEQNRDCLEKLYQQQQK